MKATRIGLALLATGLFAGFVALGGWQLERRVWKLDLIERVERRVQAAPVAPPPAAAWGRISAADDEYRRVRLSGRFLPQLDTRVQAVTTHGPGFWLLTPLELDGGGIVLVNRGFVPSPDAAVATPPGPLQLDGLLRLSEPGGGFLRRNDPAAQRWYSRDVAAIVAARGLPDAAPFFVDAGADPSAGPDQPVGGLTVISFHNSHLVYAITWFVLALMVAAAAVYVAVQNARRDDPEPDASAES